MRRFSIRLDGAQRAHISHISTLRRYRIMSFFDAIRRFFAPTPAEKAEKLRRRIVNMYGHTEDRKYALGQLHDLGPTLAPKCLIERFTCRCENGTVDADEKAYTQQLLLDLGAPCVDTLKKFLLNNDKDFSWPFRTLSDLISHEELVEFIVELLNSIGPEYVRDTERKEQLMLTIKTFEEPEIDDAALRYLNDDNETIRFVTADTIIAHGRKEGIHALCERLACETSQRILSLIANAFRDKSWAIEGDFIEKAQNNLPSEYRINEKGIIV